MIVPNGGKKYEYSGKWISNGFVSGICVSSIWRFFILNAKIGPCNKKEVQKE